MVNTSVLSDSLRIALLHCAPTFDDVDGNLAMLKQQILTAAPWKPDLIVTPELAVSGYSFAPAVGVEWIRERYSQIVSDFSALARDGQMAIILGTPRPDEGTGNLHNASLFFDEYGDVIGIHDKLSVLPGAERWSQAGSTVKPIHWRGMSIGLLICADFYAPEPAQSLADQGADFLISQAAWGPGLHEPDGEWEARSAEAGLSVVVCNRTGLDRTMDFNGGASIVAVNGNRALTYEDSAPAILLFELSTATLRPATDSFRIVPATDYDLEQ